MRKYVLLLSVFLFSLSNLLAQKGFIKVSFLRQQAITFNHSNKFDDNIRSSSLKLLRTTNETYTNIIQTSSPILIYTNHNFDIYSLLLFPGDSVFMKRESDGSYSFQGKKDPNTSTFFSTLERKFGLLQPHPLDVSNPTASNLLRQCQEKRSQRLTFLDNAQLADSALVSTLRMLITCKYLTDLLSVIYKTSVPIDLTELMKSNEYINEIETTYSTIAKKSHLSLPIFRSALWNYARFKCMHHAKKVVNNTNLYTTVSDYFPTNELKEYLLFRTLKDTYEKASLERADPQLSNYYDSYPTSEYTYYLKDKFIGLDLLTTRSNLLQTKLTSRAGETIEFGDLLKSNKGKTILLGFWATWCKPCLIDHIAIEKRYTALTEKNCQVIYISMDENKEKWQNAISHPSPVTNHFLLDPTSDLALYLEVPPVPKYVLINSNGEVVTLNAPHPSLNSELVDLIDKIR